MLNVTLPPHRLVAPSSQADRQLRKKTAPAPQPTFSGKNKQTDPNDLLSVMGQMQSGEYPSQVITAVAPHTNNSEVMEFLARKIIETQKSIDAPIFPATGATLLQSAIYSGRLNIVDTLLKMGANPLQADKQGRTALDWLERLDDRASAEDRKAIQSLLTKRLEEMVQAKEKAAAQPNSSWSFWPLRGGASKAPDAPAVTTQKAPKMVNAEAQTEPATLSSEREQALLGEMEGLRLSVKQSQKQLSKNASELDKLANGLKEAIEKNEPLQKDNKRFKQENSALQSKLQKELGNARKFEDQLSQSEATGKQNEQERQAEIATLKAENGRIQRLLDDRNRTAAQEQNQLKDKLAEALKEKAELKEKNEKGKSLEKAQQSSKEELKTLRADNEKLKLALKEQDHKAQAKFSESEQSRIRIQEDAQTQSLKQKEENYRLQKELIEQTRQAEELQAKLKAQEETLARETAALRQQLEEAGNQQEGQRAESDALHLENKNRLVVLQQKNEILAQQADQFSQQAQSLQETLEARIQAEERQTQELRDQLVSEKERHLDAENKATLESIFLKGHNQKLSSDIDQLQDEHQRLQKHFSVSENSRHAMDWHLNTMSRSWNDLNEQRLQQERELQQAQRQQGLLSKIIGELMGQSSEQKLKTQRQNATPYSLEEAVQAMDQSDNLEETLKKLANQRGQKHQKALQEQTSRALQSTSLSALDIVNRVDQDQRPTRKNTKPLWRTQSLFDAEAP